MEEVVDTRIATIVRLLRIGAVGGLLAVGWFALVMATFATDAPGSSHTWALLFGAAVFCGLAIPTAGFPWWAARRALRRGSAGLLPAILFALLALTVFPFGTILGAIILVKVRDIRRNP